MPKSMPGSCGTPAFPPPRLPSPMPTTSGSCPRPAAWPSACPPPRAKRASPVSPRTAVSWRFRQIMTATSRSTSCRWAGASQAGSPTIPRLTVWLAGSPTASPFSSPRPWNPAGTGSAACSRCPGKAACPRPCPCPTVSSARSRPMAKCSPTRPCPRTSAPGSGTAAAWPARSGSTIWRRRPPSACPAKTAPTIPCPCGTGTRSTSYRTGTEPSATTSGPST